MEIKRDAYLKQLIERKNNGMIKIITGIRKCGKSFLLFTIFKRHLLESGVDSDHIIELTLDGIENEELKDPEICRHYIRSAVRDGGNYYLLLDEVQFMPQFAEILDSLLRAGNIDVYATGNNSRFLSGSIAAELQDRCDEIKIYPLSFAEYYSCCERDYDDAWSDYMKFGGLPQVAVLQSDRQKINCLKDIFVNVYLKDIIEKYKVQYVNQLSSLVEMLASSIGTFTNASKISNTFASKNRIIYTNKTIANHLKYLMEASLITSARCYDIRGEKYIKSNLKYYFTDPGIRNSRLNFRRQEPIHIMRNIIYNELIIRGYNVDAGVVDKYTLDKDGKHIRKRLEVDFVANQGDQKYYIQVAYDMASEEKQEQEFRLLHNKPDSLKKIVIINGTAKPWRSKEGFIIIGMKHFLLNADK